MRTRDGSLFLKDRWAGRPVGEDGVTPQSTGKMVVLGHLGVSLARFDEGTPYCQCQPKPVGALGSGEQGG